MSFFKKVLEERWLLYIGLFALAVGLPLSRSFVSIAPGILGGAWLFDGLYRKDFRAKIRLFTSSRTARSTSLLLLLYAVWCTVGQEQANAFRILVNKIPLLVLPLAISGLGPVAPKGINRLLILHWAALLFVGISSLIYVHTNFQGQEIREAIRFVNHIRYALMLVFISVTMALRPILPNRYRLLEYLSIGFFAFLLYYFQLATGSALAVLVIFFLVLRVAYRSGFSFWKFALLLLFITPVIFHFSSIAYKQFHKPPVAADILLARSAEGNLYQSQLENHLLENGHYVWHYVQVVEVAREWNKVSSIAIDPSRGDADPMLGRVVRFLSSKGLRKDAEAIRLLNQREILAIEQGAASIRDLEAKGMTRRFEVLCVEVDSYLNGGDPSYSSLAVKFEYWKAALHLISQNPWIGIGTGDERVAYNSFYEKNSKLDPSAWDKAHEQYLTWFVVFGFPMGVLALFCFVRSWNLSRLYRSQSLASLIMVLFLISFLSEDTLENQIGLNTYLFYLCMLVLPASFSEGLKTSE